MRRTVPKRIVNPIRRFKDETGFTYDELAEHTGLGRSTLAHLCTDFHHSISPRTAYRLENATEGAIRFSDVMQWVYARMLEADGLEA